MRCGRVLGFALSAAATLFVCACAVTEPSRPDLRERRVIRAERSAFREVLAAPRWLVVAAHWPLKHLLFWAEDTRIDRRIADIVLWKDNDDLPAPEPEADEEADGFWWDVVWSTSVYPAGEVFDLGRSLPAVARWAGITGPDEAPNRNALDEVPDSTWFTNRHAHRRLSRAELIRGPNHGPPPSPEGALTVLSGKRIGTGHGFILQDAKGRRYLVKFDPAGYPEISTGAELVSSKILHALGWNVPEYHLVHLDPERLVISDDASMEDRYGQMVPMTARHLERLVSSAERSSDGSIRAVASRMLPGVPKGGFRMMGTRRDDPNDTIPHEDRRDLRGLRVVAAWINHIDFRRGNTLDVFVEDEKDPRGHGHLVHYLVDFNGSLGAWIDGGKPSRLGHEYIFDPLPMAARTLCLSRPGWMDAPVRHPAIGRFHAEHFDPERWKPVYPNPPFDRATFRDRFWGARLVASFSDEDLRAVVATGQWSDPEAAKLLFTALRDRRQTVAKTYFDFRRLNPLDRFAIRGGALRFRDLAVANRVVSGGVARYRYATGGFRAISRDPRVPLDGRDGDVEIALETSHDRGRTWSPPLVVHARIGETGGRVLALDRHA